MVQKIEERRIRITEDDPEYLELIKERVNDGSYFRDALDWYFFRYVNPVNHRTFLFFTFAFVVILLYSLVMMIQDSFPLIVQKPIFIKAHDQSLYFPKLVPLRQKETDKGYDPEIRTVDEAVLKYVILNYVKDREEYNFSKAEIEAVNRKFNHIKNTSSSAEYRNFQLMMSKDNQASPINDFGLNVERVIDIESIIYSRRRLENFAEKAINYLITEIPTEATVRFTATKRMLDENNEIKTESERFLVKIKFDFGGLKPKNKNQRSLQFVVNGYQLYRVK